MTLSSYAALQRSKRIGILAVSSPSETTRFAKALAELQRSGVEPQVELDPCAAYGSTQFLFASAPPHERAEALTRLLLDDSVGAILAARGAYGSAEILPLLRKDIVATQQKPLIGFSDVTALLNYWVECGAPAIHGVNADVGFSLAAEKEDSRRSVDSLLELLRTGAAPAISGTVLSPGRAAEGILVGGNLSTLVSLSGTPWALSRRGEILFIEESREKPYRIHRALVQLEQAGDLQKIHGVVVGDMIECVHATGAGPTWQEVVVRFFEDRQIPVLHIQGYGHGSVNLALPLGSTVLLNGASLSFPGH